MSWKLMKSRRKADLGGDSQVMNRMTLVNRGMTYNIKGSSNRVGGSF